MSEDAQALLEAEAVRFTRELIRIESVNTGIAATIGDGETRAALAIRDWLLDVGIEAELVEPRPGRGSLIARIPGRDADADALLVHAHLDVVPVDARDWSAPPFAAEIRDGWLIGRGAVDMKHFAGTMVAVARHFAREALTPRRDLVLAFLADEESGGLQGAGWLVEHRPDLFAGVTEALGEVGGMSVALDGGRRVYLAATGEKGSGWATLTARGHAAHGSRPTPDNAVVALATAVAAIGAHRFPTTSTPATDRLLAGLSAELGRTMTPETLDADRARLGFLADVIDAGLRTTATPTMLQAGEKVNIIPATALARVDVRVLPGQDAATRDALIALAGDDVEVAWGRGWPAVESAVDGGLLPVLQSAIDAEDPGAAVLPFLLPASTDLKHFSRLGIRGYGFTPLRVPDGFDVLAQFHAADERVPVDAIRFGARTTGSILLNA